jgi:hypothetical protein
MIFGATIGHISTDRGSGQEWSPELICASMQGLRSMDHSNNVILKGVKKLTLLVNRSDKALWTFEQASLTLLGLQSMSADTTEVKACLQAMNKKLLRMYSSTAAASVSLSSLSQGLYGLQGMNSQSNEVKQLLCTLSSYVKRINLNEEAGHGATISRCLYGLRRMNIHHAEVYSLTEMLANKINTVCYNTAEEYTAGGFNHPPTLVMIIRSLSNYSSDYQATTKLFRAVIKQYSSACKAMGGSTLSRNDLLRLLFGFKNSTNNNSEIDFCLQLLVDSLPPCTTGGRTCADDENDRAEDTMSAYDLSNALIGLRGMSNTDAKSVTAIDAILRLLTEALLDLQSAPPANPHWVTPKHLSVALQGLQGLTCGQSVLARQCPSVEEGGGGGRASPPYVVMFLDRLYETLQHQQLFVHSNSDPSSGRLDIVHNMTLSQCSRALYGLLRIHPDSSVRISTLKNDIIARVADIISTKFGDETQTHKKDITNISELLELQRVLHFHTFMYKTETGELGGQFNDNVATMSEWVDAYITQSAIIVKENETSDNSTLERRFRKAILTELSNSSSPILENLNKQLYEVKLSSNTNIQGFDVDIIVTFCKHGDDKTEFVYNLEIDGPHHKKPHKETFLQLRDSFLLGSSAVHCVRRMSLFGADPRRTKVINKGARDAAVTRELQHMVTEVQSFFNQPAS